MVPRIQQATIGEQRAMRQRQIIEAAMSLATESGANAITVAAVAKRAGIARSSIYEYFSSSADLVADLVIEELENYNKRLLAAVVGVEDPFIYLESWIAEALKYVVDGRHLLVKSLNSVNMPNFRKSEIAMGHRKLISTISKPLEELEIADVPMALSYLQGTLDAASIRIESGSDPELEVASAQQYAIAGVRALMSKSKRD